MIPAIGGVSLTSLTGQLGGLASGANSAASSGVGLAEGASAATPSVLGAGESAGAVGAGAPVGTVPGASETLAPGGSSGEGGGGFGEALTSAVSSLEQTQQKASGAAQALATGTTGDPESAVVTVEEAQLAMDLASQIRTKATEALQGIFQTQV